MDHSTTVRNEVANITPAQAAIDASDAKEPLCVEDPDRLTLLPYRIPSLARIRDQIVSSRWSSKDVALDADSADYEALSARHPGVAMLMEHALGFFAFADERLMDGIDLLLAQKVKNPELRSYLTQASAQEDVHNVTYNLQLEVLPPARREAVRRFVLDMPAVSAMSDFIRAWLRPGVCFSEIVVVLAHIEGVMFSDKFAILQSLKRLKLMSGLVTFNEYIVRDENIHASVWAHIARDLLKNRPSEEFARETAEAVVALCDAFIDEATGDGWDGSAVGLTPALLKQYSRFASRVVSARSGYEPAYPDAENPLDFMAALEMNSTCKTNFFEEEATQYQGASAGARDFGADLSGLTIGE